VVIDRPQGLHSNVCNLDRSPICNTVRANLKGSPQLGHPAGQSVQILSTRAILPGVVDRSFSRFGAFAVDIDQPGKGRLISATRKERVRLGDCSKKEAPLGWRGARGKDFSASWAGPCEQPPALRLRPHIERDKRGEHSAGPAANPIQAISTFRARSSEGRNAHLKSGHHSATQRTSALGRLC
jgi:hypothetical protein